MKLPKRPALIAASAVALTVGLTACTGGPSSAEQKDTNAVNHNFNTMESTQPVPQADRSQVRQTLIDAQDAAIHGVATTTFFYNQGSNVPLMTCPSLGFPVAATDELTNPEKVVWPNSGSNGFTTMPQGEATGIYTGSASSGTYVVCVLPDGEKQVDEWEGFVYTAGGAAHFDKASGQIVEDSSTVTAHVTK